MVGLPQLGICRITQIDLPAIQELRRIDWTAEQRCHGASRLDAKTQRGSHAAS
jgi:hypothetical protein